MKLLPDTHVLHWALGSPARSGQAALQNMPLHHRDPFDRLLLAQALTEPAWLYTADKQLARYEGPVRCITAP